jgi:hypothetical protein
MTFTPVLIEGLFFLTGVHPQAVRKQGKINLVPVELRAVHTGKLRLTPDGDPAGAAHPCCIHHDRIQADDGLDAVRPRHVANDAHHGHGADSEDFVNLLARIN